MTTAAESLNISGHGLRNEGAPFIRVPRGWELKFPTQDTVAGDGYGICECGANSANLPSAAARKRWHRVHKEAVLSEQGN